MKFSRYIGDMSIDLEGKPEEIIQVLKYLDGVDDKSGEIVLTIDGEEIVKTVGESVKNSIKQDIERSV